MIDWVKIICHSQELTKRVLSDPRFKWNDTDVFSWGTLKGYADGFEVEINEPTGQMKVGFSLHKYFNASTGAGNQNYNDFVFTDICRAVQSAVEYFGNDILIADVINIEFGLNITPPIPTPELLHNCHSHRKQRFVVEATPEKLYFNCIHSQYRVKIYDKGLQYGLSDPLLRFELHFGKMEKIRPLGVTIFRDLLNPEIYPRLLNLLLSEWDKVLFIDTTLTNPPTPKLRAKFKAWKTHEFWTRLFKKQTAKKVCAEVDRYNKYVNTHSDGLQRQTRGLIQKKWEYLTTAQRNPQPEKSGKTDCLYNSIGAIIPNIRVCKVTGLPIQHQRPGTVFLSIGSIREIFYSDRRTFDTVLLPLLPEQYRNASEAVQFAKIKKAIKNADSNPRNYAKEAVRRLTENPSLFDNLQLIRPDVLQLAGVI